MERLRPYLTENEKKTLDQISIKIHGFNNNKSVPVAQESDDQESNDHSPERKAIAGLYLWLMQKEMFFPPLPKLSILVVEDNPTDQASIRQALASISANIKITDNYEDGAIEVDSGKFDVAIFDLELPRWPLIKGKPLNPEKAYVGRELGELLCYRAISLGLPFIVLSSKLSPKDPDLQRTLEALEKVNAFKMIAKDNYSTTLTKELSVMWNLGYRGFAAQYRGAGKIIIRDRSIFTKADGEEKTLDIPDKQRDVLIELIENWRLNRANPEFIKDSKKLNNAIGLQRTIVAAYQVPGLKAEDIFSKVTGCKLDIKTKSQKKGVRLIIAPEAYRCGNFIIETLEGKQVTSLNFNGKKYTLETSSVTAVITELIIEYCLEDNKQLVGFRQTDHDKADLTSYLQCIAKTDEPLLNISGFDILEKDGALKIDPPAAQPAGKRRKRLS